MSREVARIVVRALVAAFVLVGVHASFVAEPAQASVCDAIPSIPLVPNPVKGGCKVATGVAGVGADVLSNPGKAATHVLTAPLKAAGDEVMKGVTNWVAKGAGWLVAQA